MTLRTVELAEAKGLEIAMEFISANCDNVFGR